MPTYEYECTRCGRITSEFKPMSAPRRQRCPSCRGKVSLLISGGLGVLFKGDGFYINDSRKASRPQAARSGAAPANGDTPTDKPAAAGATTGDGPGARKTAADGSAAGPKQGASPSGTVHDTGKGSRNKD